MSVLFSLMAVVPFRIGGQESFARELSLQIGERGWKSVLCFAEEPSPAVKDYLDLPNTTIEVLQSPEQVRWSSVRGLARLLRKHRPDIVHLHYTPFLGPYPWVARACGVSRVFHTDHAIRQAYLTPQPGPLWKRLAARAVNWPLTRVICVSQYGYQTLTIPDFLPLDRFVLIYNALDFSRVDKSAGQGTQFRHKYGIPEKRPIVLQVSWMIPEKGVGEFLQMAQIVRRQRPDAHFVLVGDGAWRSEFMQLATKLGLQNCGTWTGLIEDPFAEGVFSAADVVCQLSQCEELSPFTLAEAMAFSKPVVGTLAGGIPEYVVDGQTGYVVPRDDIQQAAERVLRLLADESLRDKMGRAGRQRAEAKFDLQRNIAELLRVYGFEG